MCKAAESGAQCRAHGAQTQTGVRFIQLRQPKKQVVGILVEIQSLR